MMVFRWRCSSSLCVACPLPWPMLCLACALFILPTCVPSSAGVCPSSYCLSLKPVAQAAHQLTATELPGPPEASALCVCRQINEVFAFLWQSGAFPGGQRGWLPGGKWVLLMRLKTQLLKGQVVLNVLAHYPQIIYTLGYCLPFPKAAGKYVNGFSFI